MEKILHWQDLAGREKEPEKLNIGFDVAWNLIDLYPQKFSLVEAAIRIGYYLGKEYGKR